MHFCDKCDNMLYIKLADEDTDELIYYCRNCGDNVPIVDEQCILRTNLSNNQEKHQLFINKFTKLDPTLPRTNSIKCPNEECSSNKTHSQEDDGSSSSQSKEVIYIRYDDERMKYLYLCSNCDYVWKTSI